MSEISRIRRLCVATSLAMFALPAASESLPSKCAVKVDWQSAPYYYDQAPLALGIPVDDFTVLLRALVPAKQSTPGFPVDLMTRAVARVETRTYDVRREDGSGLGAGPEVDPSRPVRLWMAQSGSYSPTIPASDAERARYAAAVDLYRANAFSPAVTAFDAIAADPNSPYRAASAYSAARARILEGQISDGIRRLGSLLADPGLHEFHTAARHLVGTLSYQGDQDVRLRAAKYAQMLELGFPAKPACNDEAAAVAQREELSDLDWYLDLYRGSGSQFRVLDELAGMDARFDVLRALALGGSTFANGAARGWSFSWPEGKSGANGEFEWNTEFPVATPGTGGAIERLTTPEQRAITAHARERWLATRNPLWALAFAQRTLDPSDAALVAGMIDELDRRVGADISAEAGTALRLHFLRHAVRLRIQQGQAEQALALIERERAHLRLNIAPSKMPSFLSSPRDRLALDVLEAPLVHYLRRMDFAAARTWLPRVRAVGGEGVGKPWQLLLARDLGDVIPSDGTWDSFTRLSQMGPILDWQPVRTLLKLARDPDTPQPARRALVGAAWVRLFALERTSEWWALLPELRQSFPELSADFDSLAGIGAEQRRYRAALILLASPGIGILPSQMHEIRAYLKSARPETRPLSRVDSLNPSDGNWWCALGPEYLKRDLVVTMYLGPTASAERGTYVWAYDRSTDFYTNTADQLLARHPLLAGISRDELRRLQEIPSGVAQLAAIVFARDSARFRMSATAEEKDLMAKALHDVVRASRYGCRRQGSMASLSREAYRRLHYGYASTSWARATRYWYDFGYDDPRMPQRTTR